MKRRLLDQWFIEMNLIIETIEESIRIKKDLIYQRAYIEEAVEMLKRTIDLRGTIYFCGNGGSAADAQHLAAELVVRYKRNRAPIRAMSLSTDTSILTACGNDLGYDQIFSRQLEAHGQSDDCLVAISTSGASSNVLRGMEVARAIGMNVIGLTGQACGNDFSRLSSSLIKAPSSDTARIQECHILIGHILCDILERRSKR